MLGVNKQNENELVWGFHIRLKSEIVSRQEFTETYSTCREKLQRADNTEHCSHDQAVDLNFYQFLIRVNKLYSGFKRFSNISDLPQQRFI